MDVPTPFAEFTTQIGAGDVDFNGHLNDAVYARILTDANEVFLDWLGLSRSYRERSGGAMYTVEMTIRFLREVALDEVVSAATLLAGHDAKRLRLRTTLHNQAGLEVAEGETLYLHVDAGGSGRVAPFPDDRAQVLDTVTAAHTVLAENTHDDAR